MTEEVKIYICLCIIVVSLLLFLIFYNISSNKKKARYYNYQIKYEADLEKYLLILKKQKKIIFKKQIKLIYLQFLIKIKKGF